MDEQKTIEFKCTKGEGCHRLFGITIRPPSVDCPSCDVVTITRRTIPACENFWKGPWIEVFQVDGEKKGERNFYHGKEYTEGLRVVQSIAQPVAPNTEIHACQDQGRVRFFVAVQ